MIIIYGFALLILAIGMVVLFAMFGELSTRIAEAGPQIRSTEIVPVENSRLGHVPDSWPAGLPGKREGLSVMLVLSSACNSCADVATQLRENPGYAGWNGMAIVVSTASRRAGEEFVASHGLAQFPHYIDDGGAWVTTEFGINASPSALVFDGGELIAAYSFHDIRALREKVSQLDAHDAREQQREAV